jgi:hypothetical protein
MAAVIGELRPCRRCGGTVTVTRLMVTRGDYICRECRRKQPYRNAEYQRAWRVKNAARVRAKEAAYRLANRELFRRASQEWRARNPDRVRAIQRRRTLKRYKLAEAEYQCLFNEQGGLCAICRQPPPSGRARNTKNRQLAIDHCHATKVVRGLLCFRCNSILGNACDEVAILRACISYLERSCRR